MAKAKSGWHRESLRHSQARRLGTARGKYTSEKSYVNVGYNRMGVGENVDMPPTKFQKLYGKPKKRFFADLAPVDSFDYSKFQKEYPNMSDSEKKELFKYLLSYKNTLDSDDSKKATLKLAQEINSTEGLTSMELFSLRRLQIDHPIKLRKYKDLERKKNEIENQEIEKKVYGKK